MLPLLSTAAGSARCSAVPPILIPHLGVDGGEAKKVGGHLLPTVHGSLHQRSEASLVLAVGVHTQMVHQVLHPGDVALPARKKHTEEGSEQVPNANNTANRRVRRTEVVSGDAKFQCQDCERTFNSQSALSYHRKSKHEGVALPARNEELGQLS